MSNRRKYGQVDSGQYVEAHHIIPKCLGGSNKKENIVVLTAREHFIAHYILTRVFNGCDPIIMAFSIMCGRTKGKSSKDYAVLRENSSRISSERSQIFWTEDEREKARIRGKKLAKDPEYLEKVSKGVQRAFKTTNLREKIAKSSKKRYQDPEYKERWLKSQEKRNEEYWTEENKEKLSKRVKRENKTNPELKKKRLDAIKDHMYNKSDEWKEVLSISLKKYNAKPEVKKKNSEKYFKKNSKFNNSRVVINKDTGEEYRSMQDAAKKLGMNYQTLKKYLYKNMDKCPVYFKKESEDEQTSNENERTNGQDFTKATKDTGKGAVSVKKRKK